MKLPEVHLLKHDTCYTYALKRTNNFTFENVTSTAEEFIARYKTDKPKIDDLEVGDILIYQDEITSKNTWELARFINEDAQIIWTEIYTNLHFMVYEGNGLVSDACIEKDICLGLRLNKLEDISDKWKRLRVI